MSFLNIEDHEVLRFSNNVVAVAQQMRNLVEGAMTSVPVSGEASRVADLLGTIEAEYGEKRGRRNPESDVERTNRWLVMPDPLEAGAVIYKEDQFALALDPSGQISRALTAGVVRKRQDAMLGVVRNPDGTYSIGGGGVMGSALSGKRFETSSVLPSGNYVPHTSTGLTLDKLRLAIKNLQQADFGIDENLDPIFCAITPQQNDDLLGIAAASGAALNAFQIAQLQTGKPTPLLGVNWIMTNRLPKVSTTRYCPMWTKANMLYGDWQGIQGRMWNLTESKMLPYAYVSAYTDAVRVQDAGVRILECTEPA